MMSKGEHMNEQTYERTYIRTGQTLYPLHNFVVRGDKNKSKRFYLKSVMYKSDYQKSYQINK